MGDELTKSLLDIQEEQMNKLQEMESIIGEQQNQIDRLMANENTGQKAQKKKKPSRPTFTVDGKRYRWRFAGFYLPTAPRDLLMAQDVNKDTAQRSELLESMPHLFEELPAKAKKDAE